MSLLQSETFLPLARKWRPKTLADLTGQQYVVRALQNAVRQNRLHHAYLFTGTRGIGKTTLARIVAMLVNCEQRGENGDEPCLQCDTCRTISEGRLTDVMELDAASHTQVEKMRELLESAVYAPVRAKFKIFIIDEVHMLSKNAFNAMLKTLEEPPPHVKFILATTDPHKLPTTVRSRCLCFGLLPLTVQQISERLTHILQTESVAFQPAAVEDVARLANGSLRDALSILEQAIAHSDGEIQTEDVRRMTGDVGWALLGDTLRAVASGDAAGIQTLTARHVADNIDLDSALARLAALLYKTALAASVAAALPEAPDEAAIVNEMKTLLSAEELQVLYEIAVRGRQQLPLAPDSATGFEMTLLRMMLFAPKAAALAEPTPPPSKATPPPAQQNTVAAATPPPAPTPPPSPTPKATANNGNNDTWEGVVAQISDAARALTEKCLMEHYDKNGVHLRLDKSHAGITKTLLPILETELRALCGDDFNVRLSFGEDNAAAQAEVEKNMSAAHAAPFIKEVMDAFPAAHVLPTTVKLAEKGEKHE